MRTWYVALALLVAPVGAAATAAGAGFRRFVSDGDLRSGERRCITRRPRGAISNYRRLTEAGIHDPDVYFNLATSFAQSGDYARAILNHERALTLRPNDSKASENLRAAEKALEERRAELEGEATIQRSSSISDADLRRFVGGRARHRMLVANLLFFRRLWRGPRSAADEARLALRAADVVGRRPFVLCVWARRPSWPASRRPARRGARRSRHPSRRARSASSGAGRSARGRPGRDRRPRSRFREIACG